MQTCYNCGKQVPDGTLICPDCGALVRRYNTPEQPAGEPRAAQEQPLQPPQPQPPQPNQKVRLYGPVRVWLIILCVISAYMAFSSLCSVFLAANPQVFSMMLEEPGMESLAPMMQNLQELLPQVLPLFIILLVLFSAKFACHLWLLLSGRRLPFFVGIGVSAAGLLSAFFLGGSLTIVLYFLDPMFTWLGLKRFWPWMRP